MAEESNNPDESRKDLRDLSKLLGHHSEEFAKIAHLDKDFVANYLIGFLSEGDLRLLQEPSYLKGLLNGIVALKWHSVHNINYEISYAVLHQRNPASQPEFDIILNELLLLTKSTDSES
jgi:hypothetical protein